MNEELGSYLITVMSPERTQMFLDAEKLLINLENPVISDAIDRALGKLDDLEATSIIGEIELELTDHLVKGILRQGIRLNTQNATMSSLTQLLKGLDELPFYMDYQEVLDILDDLCNDHERFIQLIGLTSSLDVTIVDELVDWVSPTFFETLREAQEDREALAVAREQRDDVAPYIAALKANGDELVLNLVRSGLGIGLDFDDYEDIVKDTIYREVSNPLLCAKSIIAINLLCADRAYDIEKLIERISRLISDVEWVRLVAKELRKVGIDNEEI